MYSQVVILVRQQERFLSSPENQLCLTPALQKLLRCVRTNSDQATLIQAACKEQQALAQCVRKKTNPGELAPRPVNKDGARATRPGADRTGRPPDQKGHRVGVGGYLTPEAKSNHRPDGQVVLRRDCTLPVRLRMAEAITQEGVKTTLDLKQLLPKTWMRLELQFARTRWFPI